MVEIKKIWRPIAMASIILMFTMGWTHAQQPNPEGVALGQRYKELLQEEDRLRQQEDSITQVVGDLRGQLRSRPEERNRISSEILQLENQIFEIRSRKGRLVDSINALEQEWVMARLDGVFSGDESAEMPQESGEVATAQQPKLRNLVYNSYFRDHLSADDYQLLMQAQIAELKAVEMVNGYMANYQTLNDLAGAYDAANTESEAREISDRFAELQQLNDDLADSLSRTWNRVFDDKSYIYGYLLDQLGREDLLNSAEERLSVAMQQEATMQGKTVSDELVDYFLRKRVAVDYEKVVAGVLDFESARDSLNGVLVQLDAVNYRLPKVTLTERLFLVYEDVTFPKATPYSYQNPVPECRIYEKGTIYRILLGTFNTKRAVATFRGAVPLSYEINVSGKWCYYTGGFATVAEAEDACKLLKKKGFVRPEVVMWRDGVRRNITREPLPQESKIYRVEIEQATQLDEATQTIIKSVAPSAQISKAGAERFVVGAFGRKSLADSVAMAVEQHHADWVIKVTEVAQ